MKIRQTDELVRQIAPPSWRRRRGIFHRRRMNDPLLVFNMSIFNTEDGWSRMFNPMKIHENGT
jgi:hypothetical protein